MIAWSNSVLRSVCALAIGVLLVVWPDAAMIYLVLSIGVLFFVPGLISLLGFFAHHKGETAQTFSVAALGSTLFGLWLIIMPAFFVSILMYILGAFLVLAGIQLIAGLVSARRYKTVSVGFFVVPVVILLAGLLVLLNPFASASIPFIILGISCIFYSISDIINYYKFRQQEKASVVEIHSEEEENKEDNQTPPLIGS